MKKIYFALLLLLNIVFMPNLVLAEENVAKVDGKSYTTIEEAMTNAEGTKNEVVLLKDVTLAKTKVVNKDLTIDLNNHSIKYSSLLFEVYGATFTVKGTGTLEETVPNYAPIAVYGHHTNDESFKSVVNVSENVTLKGWSGIMVREYNKYSGKTVSSNNSYGIEVNMNGKAIALTDSENVTGSGIYVNGNIANTENTPVITFDKTASITSEGIGIYSAGSSTVKVLGGTISAYESGIEMRAGTLVVNDGKITSTAKELKVVSNTNGSTTTGAGIAIAQHNTGKNVNVTINGGEISGFVAVNEANPENNKTDVISKVKLEINGGTFNSTNTANDKAAVKTEDVTGFIKGGKYNVDVTNYIASGYTTRVINKLYVVGTLNDVVVNKVDNGTVTTDKKSAINGETITLTTTAKEGYILSEIKVTDKDGKAVTVENNTFEMPNSKVTISATFILKTATTEIPVASDKTELGVVNQSEAEKVLLDTLNKELSKVINDKSVKVSLEFEKVSDTKDLKEKFNEAVKDIKDVNIVSFYNIKVSVKNVLTNEEVGVLSELTDKITLMISIPNDIKEVDEGHTRNYYIIREHDGKIEVIKDVKVSEDGKTLEFESDRFSTYAIAYNDVETVAEVPKTSDNVSLFVTLGFISIIAIGVSYNTLRKRLHR